MKFLKITAAVLSFVLLTACNSGQSVQTSAAVSDSETSAVTTSETSITAAKTETETVPEMKPVQK